MKRYYCTYFDRNYLVKALGLIESFHRCEKKPFHLFAVCLDELTRTLLTNLAYPNITAIPLHDIEKGDFALLRAKGNRSLVEYYWTLTPTILLRILEAYPEIKALTYLDADLFFYSSPDPIFSELGTHSMMIHEHRFSPSMKHLEPYGKYNVGLVSFKNDASGLKALNWWRERCIEWCYMRFEDGKYGDQLYLNDWPTRFEGVKVLENIGAGVAPWNHEQYHYNLDESGRVLVNGQPLIFYHFHGLVIASPDLIIPAVHHHPLTEEILRFCFLPYIRALSRGIDAVRSLLPDFAFGLEAKDALLSSHTFLVKSRHTKEITRSGAPQIPIRLDDEWDCFCSRQLKRSSRANKTTLPSQHKEKIESPLPLGQQPLPESPQLKTAHDWNRTGEAFFLKGAMDSALDAFKKATDMDPTFVNPRNNLGVLFWQAGEIQKALDCFIQAMEIDPNDQDTTLNCAELLKRIGKVEDAKEIYAGYLQRNPNDREVSDALLGLGGA